MVLNTQMTTVIYSSDQKRLHCLSRRDVDPQMAVLVADRLSTASNWPLANYMHYTFVSESTSTTLTLRSLLTYLYLFSSSSIWNLHTMCETLKWAFFWPCVGTDLSLEHRSKLWSDALPDITNDPDRIQTHDPFTISPKCYTLSHDCSICAQPIGLYETNLIRCGDDKIKLPFSVAVAHRRISFMICLQIRTEQRKGCNHCNMLGLSIVITRT